MRVGLLEEGEHRLPSLVVGDEPQPSQSRRFFPSLRLRGGGDIDFVIGTLSCIFVGLTVGYFLLASPLDPNDYGIKRNCYNGQIDTRPYRGGLHLLPPWKAWIVFPATQVTLEFSRRSTDRPPVITRTGADPADPDSGGQPISISCAFQILITPDKLDQIYLDFGGYSGANGAKERYILLSYNMVSNVAQEFTPQDFWHRRNFIADRMLKAVNDTLWHNGHAYVTKFQIMKVDFAQLFEDSITAVQVAEQSKVVNEYVKNVTSIVQAIEILKSENNALIANISAHAEATSKILQAAAKRDAFKLKQGMKAKKYKELGTALELESDKFTDYMKIKALQHQASSSKVVVGMAEL